MVALVQELAHNAHGGDRQLDRAVEAELAWIGHISYCINYFRYLFLAGPSEICDVAASAGTVRGPVRKALASIG